MFICGRLWFHSDQSRPHKLLIIAKLMGLFEELSVDGGLLDGALDHFGLTLNEPKVPAIIPRFTTLPELTGKMSEVITRAINVDTNITAEYVAASSSVAGSFLFGIAFEKDIAYDLSFSSSVDLGDFATLSVINSGLSIGGSFRLANEFGKDCHVSRLSYTFMPTF